LIKLDTSVKTVAGVDGPITSSFAPGKCVPDTSVGDLRNLCTRLDADPENAVASWDDHDIGYWHSPSFDAVHFGDGKCDVLGAGGTGILHDLAAHV
jgi:hypothetical protein